MGELIQRLELDCAGETGILNEKEDDSRFWTGASPTCKGNAPSGKNDSFLLKSLFSGRKSCKYKSCASVWTVCGEAARGGCCTAEYPPNNNRPARHTSGRAVCMCHIRRRQLSSARHTVPCPPRGRLGDYGQPNDPSLHRCGAVDPISGSHAAVPAALQP